MTEFEAFLRRLVDALDRAGVPYMITGSLASTAYGQPRTTYDLDIVIDPSGPEAMAALLGQLSGGQYYLDATAAQEALRRRSMFNLVDRNSGWKADFIIRRDRTYSREEFSRRRRFALLGLPVYVASPEDTIISKLEWSRSAGGSERQRRDVAGILATSGGTLERAWLERWIRELALEDEWRQAQTAAGT